MTGRTVRKGPSRLARALVAPLALLAAPALAVIPAGAATIPLARGGGPSGATRATGRLVPLGQAPVLPPGSIPVGPVSGVGSASVSVALTPRDPAALAQYADSVADPSSPDYRHFLTPAQFADAFGPSAETVGAVRAALRGMGLRPGPTSVNRLLIPLRATAGAVDAAFHVHLERYRLKDHRRVYANTSAPLVPASLRQGIAGIDGLSDLGPPQHLGLPVAGGRSAAPRRQNTAPVVGPGPAACPAAQAVPDGAGYAYTAGQIASAYGLTGLYGASPAALGQGVTVAVVEYEPFSVSDLTAFADCYLGATQAAAALQRIKVVPVDSGAGSGGGSGEAALDLEVLLQTAPDASYQVYEAPPTSGTEVPVYNAIVAQDTASVVSTSWSSCEAVRQAYAPGELAQLNTLFEEAAVQGQSVLAAAGDSGAQGCLMQHSLVAADDKQASSASSPGAETIDPTESTVYVANTSSGIDGSVGVLTESSSSLPFRTVGISGQPAALWVDPRTHVAYAATSLGQVIPLTDCYPGASGCSAGKGVSDPRHAIGAPSALSGDPGFSGGRLYVANPGQQDVVVVSEATAAVAGTVPLPAGSDPALLAVDPMTHDVYVADDATDRIYEFPEPACASGICAPTTPTAVVSLGGPASAMTLDASGNLYVAVPGELAVVSQGVASDVALPGMVVTGLADDPAGAVLAIGSSRGSSGAVCPAGYVMEIISVTGASGGATAGPCIPAQGSGPVAVVVDPTSQLAFTADALSHGVEVWDLAPAVQDPSSQPDVTAVGGTSLLGSGTPGAPGERVWNEAGVSGGAGGGGTSSVWPIPVWQPRLAQAGQCGQSLCREVPDVSASADPYHGYAVYYQGSWQPYGGTSAAAPLWAGIVAVAASSCAPGPARFGLLDPTLYALAQSRPQDFNHPGPGAGDIDYTGTNGAQPAAGEGYDMATGLGSPSAASLARDLCTYSVGSPQSVAFATSSLAASGSAAWRVGFVTDAQGALVAGVSTITVGGPPGTRFPVDAGQYLIQGEALAVAPQVGTSQVTLVVPASVPALAPVSISVASVTNPPSASGPYPSGDFTVSTSADTEPSAVRSGLAFLSGGLSIATGSLPTATVGQAYSASLTPAGGTPPYSWSLVGGPLPPGLSLTTGGTLAGSPGSAGSVELVVALADSSSPAQSVELGLSLTVSGASVDSGPGGAVPSGGGSSGAPLVPPPPAGAVDPQAGLSASPNGTASAVSGSSSATGEGEGALLVSSYAGDPSSTAPPPGAAGGSYAFFDVRVGAGSAFSVVTVSYCGGGTGAQLLWLQGAAWQVVAPQSSAGGCLGAQLSGSSSPTPSQLMGTVFAVAVSGAAGTSGVVLTRIGGADREATAIAASRAAFPAAGSAPAVVLARSDQYADALAGAPLAMHLGGPLLITSPMRLDGGVLTEIARVLAPGGQVYLLGGPAALSPAVPSELEAAGFGTQRIFGPDRYATAVAIAAQLGPLHTVFEVTGLDFADALAAGPPAMATGGAVLLTAGGQQAPETAAFLAGLGSVTRYALGGPAAAADPSATAVVGADRYATATLAAQRFFRIPPRVGIATGLNFPDALAGGPLLGGAGPLLLVPPAGSLPPELSAYLQGLTGVLGQVDVFGGTAAIGQQVLGEVSTAVGGVASEG